MATDNILLRTLGGLEDGLTVSLIASSPIETCKVTDSMVTVLAREDWKDFDIVPVTTNGRITGVLRRDTGAVQPLDGTLLVSSRCPIHELLLDTSFVEDGFRLVLSGGKINGIVTISDLLRLPVRVLVFTLVSHFESTMAAVIAARCPDNTWMTMLKADRQDRINERAEDLKRDRLDASKLEASDFSDKKEILHRLKVFSNKQAEKAGGLEKLRNEVAHGRDYVHDRPSLGKFLERVERTTRLQAHLEKHLADPMAAQPALTAARAT